MRNLLITLALVAPLAGHAAPHAAFPLDQGAKPPAIYDHTDASGPFRMSITEGRPTGGMPGALSAALDQNVSTDLLDAVFDEAIEMAVAQAALPFKVMRLPPLAGAWLGGLSRPPVLLPEPFSYSILSIGLLGFIVSRFRRTP